MVRTRYDASGYIIDDTCKCTADEDTTTTRPADECECGEWCQSPLFRGRGRCEYDYRFDDELDIGFVSLGCICKRWDDPDPDHTSTSTSSSTTTTTTTSEPAAPDVCPCDEECKLPDFTVGRCRTVTIIDWQTGLSFESSECRCQREADDTTTETTTTKSTTTDDDDDDCECGERCELRSGKAGTCIYKYDPTTGDQSDRCTCVDDDFTTPKTTTTPEVVQVCDCGDRCKFADGTRGCVVVVADAVVVVCACVRA